MVVIAIIAILAAMLLPSLSRSRYQARLITCTSMLHQWSLALFTYATDSDDQFPYWSANSHKARGLPSTIWAHSPDSSDVPLISPYIDDETNCPFVEKMPIIEKELDPGYARGQLSYAIYAGWQIAKDEERMDRPGRKSTFKGEDFDVMVGDISVLYRDDAVFTSHPDRNGGILGLKSTWKHGNPLWSMWQNYDTHFRGPLDLNYVRGDGSGFRVNALGLDDSRVSRVHYKWTNASKALSSRWAQLPPAE